MIEYNPNDLKESNDYKPFPVGDYESEVLDANQMVSKSNGNDMIRLNHLVTNDDGGTTRIYDYIVIPNHLWKLKQICECLSMPFEGTMNEQDLVGKRLKIKLGIDKGNVEYPKPKNVVKKYLEGLGVTAKVEQVATPAIPKDDDIPF
mgnify:CR=1 FL=1|tara:strand:- start:699 stop:1139 length:441 start_codon:yes stop_codon:yes gene_type:complete